MRSLLLVLLLSSVAHAATMWQVTFDSGSNLVVGIVDSDADTFTITDFTSGDANQHAPILPLVMTGQEHTGSNTVAPIAWDVPEFTMFADLQNAMNTSGVGFMVSATNAAESWDTTSGVSSFFAAGWGLGGANIGFPSPIYGDSNSNSLFRWPWGSNGNQSMTFSGAQVTAVEVPEPSTFVMALFASLGALGWHRRYC